MELHPLPLRLARAALAATALAGAGQAAATTATLCLDFDGHRIARWKDRTDIDIPPFNHFGSDPATLDADELRDVDYILAAVREDFSPFDIVVLSEEPPTADGSERPGGCPLELPKGAGLRAVVGGHASDFREDFVAGGYALVGSFNSADPNVPNVVLAFANDRDNTATLSARDLADTVSHEAGHGFSLRHQAEYDDNGAWVDQYEPGNLDQSPLMGDYSVPSDLLMAPLRTTWWLGPVPYLQDEHGYPAYPDRRPAYIQDDMRILGALSPAELPDALNCAGADIPANCVVRPPNGFGFRPDDHGDAAGYASPLTQSPNGSLLQASGIIEHPNDFDYFSFVVPRGSAASVTVHASVAVAPTAPNLNAAVEIRNLAGSHTYASGGGTGSGASYLGARAIAQLAPGEYRVLVRSHGDPGDAGQYDLQLRINSGPAILRHVLMKDRIRVTFNEAIEPSTFTPDDVLIEDGAGNKVAPGRIGVVAAKGLVRTYDVTFPEYTLRDGLRAWIGPRIENLRKVNMDQDGDGRVTSADKYYLEDRIAPRVAGIKLRSGSIEVRFDEPLDPSTVNAQTLRLYDAAANPVNPAAAPSRVSDTQFEQVLSAYPAGGIALEIGNGVTDRFGNLLDPVYRLERIDGDGPRVTGTAYLDNGYLPGYGTVRQDAVLVAFDEVIDADSLVAGSGYNITLSYFAPPQPGLAVSQSGTPVSVTDIHSYEAGGFQGGGTDRLWVVSFVPPGFGEYELTVGTRVTDLFGNALNQDGDAVNGEPLHDYYRRRFELKPTTPATFEQSDAYRLAGRMVWGDEWLLFHAPPAYSPEDDPRSW